MYLTIGKQYLWSYVYVLESDLAKVFMIILALVSNTIDDEYHESSHQMNTLKNEKLTWNSQEENKVKIIVGCLFILNFLLLIKVVCLLFSVTISKDLHSTTKSNY